MRRFVAMQHFPDDVFRPRNRKMYDTAGSARHYSKTRIYNRNDKDTLIDDGHVLVIDFDRQPRVLFDKRGKATGIGVEDTPTLAAEYENAEQMIEVWAKRAAELRERLRKGEGP
jgi:hypothetical protein